MAKRLQITDAEIMDALEQADGIRSQAAHSLGISPRTLARRLASDPELAISRADREARELFEVLKAVYNAAIGGDVYAQIQWLKSRGWGRDVRTPQLAVEFVLAPGAIRLAAETSTAETGEPADEPGQTRKSHP